MAATTLPQRRKLDVDAYHRMAEVGILGPDERVELIAGEIVEMVPIGSEHGATVIRFNRLFDPAALAGTAIVAVQSPLRLNAHSEPVPDLMLLRPRTDDYASGHPTPADVLLAVEVAKSSLDYDRGPKADLYAAAGVAELWVVDLAGRRVEVCRAPGSAGYGERRWHAAGTLAPANLPAATIDLADVFA